MLCDKCKKNEATVHIKEFHNGKCTNFHLCEQCAKNSGEEVNIPGIGFNLAEVLLNVNKFSENIHSKHDHRKDDSVCPVCNWTTDKIRQNDGKVGCPACYHTFDKLIKEAVSQVQRGSLHLGKRPRSSKQKSPALKRNELESLQKELRMLIANEEYEAAAVCRDRINIVKAELAELEHGEEK
ncbi:MAG: hypothetical protein E7043_03695 [Lentisphaerae bacterium]|nr:hypothetical protein [Lentisphaerota bacterium]